LKRQLKDYKELEPNVLKKVKRNVP